MFSLNPIKLLFDKYLWAIELGLALAALAFVGALYAKNLNLKAELATVRADCAMKAADAEREARATSERYRIEEQRRIAAQKEAADEADRKLTQARADAAIADAAVGRLSQRVNALIAEARAAARNPGPAASSAPAADPIGLLADVFGRCVARVRLLAAVADERGIAGATCEAHYDALNNPEAAP